ncbi:MAG: hypothetical protein DSM106950_23985 [Stigonema ocellatum SAG 48.90 = DSM 106950]|nr:hypothetical protein [Stigonema ocellatum SAG 48.90 = DSM 106950]
MDQSQQPTQRFAYIVSYVINMSQECFLIGEFGYYVISLKLKEQFYTTHTTVQGG